MTEPAPGWRSWLISLLQVGGGGTMGILFLAFLSGKQKATADATQTQPDGAAILGLILLGVLAVGLPVVLLGPRRRDAEPGMLARGFSAATMMAVVTAVVVATLPLITPSPRKSRAMIHHALEAPGFIVMMALLAWAITALTFASASPLFGKEGSKLGGLSFGLHLIGMLALIFVGPLGLSWAGGATWTDTPIIRVGASVVGAALAGLVLWASVRGAQRAEAKSET